ncbi:MAG TPA: response regulator transcription factor [Longimicrobiales bacterium]|nr:response regulator transcription factor [Longimicrobiales bacterium]
MTRVVIVEDNESLALGLARSLEAAGYDVAVVGDGDSAVELVRADPPSLLLLDLSLPGRDGFGVLRALREHGVHTPVLILSARGQEAEKVQGFRLGADDYVVKPVGVLELLARVEAILRRSEPRRSPGVATADASGTPDPRPLHFGDVTVDPARRVVTKGGADVELTPREFDLLVCLLRRDGAAVARETLLTEVWGYKVPVPTRTIDTHVSTLRGKLEDDPSRPRHVVTVRKVGYRLDR